MEGRGQVKGRRHCPKRRKKRRAAGASKSQWRRHVSSRGRRCSRRPPAQERGGGGPSVQEGEHQIHSVARWQRVSARAYIRAGRGKFPNLLKMPSWMSNCWTMIFLDLPKKQGCQVEMESCWRCSNPSISHSQW